MYCIETETLFLIKPRIQFLLKGLDLGVYLCGILDWHLLYSSVIQFLLFSLTIVDTLLTLF